MTSPKPWISILALALATSGLTGCSGAGGPLQAAFSSELKLDGTDARAFGP